MQRSPRTRFAAASIALVATITFAACGDDDDDTTGTESPAPTDVVTTDGPIATGDPDETTATGDTLVPGADADRDEYVAAAQEQLEGIGASDPACIAAALITEDIHAALVGAGITVEEFAQSGPGGAPVDDEMLETAAGQLADCDGLAAGIADTAEQQACIEASFDNEELARLMTFNLFNGAIPDDLQEASDEVDACYQELDEG
jgi:hypothetical protein